MNLVILHGNGLIAQSNKISSIKKNFDKLAILELDGKEKNFLQIIPELSTASLFISQRLVILDNFDEKIDLTKLPYDENLTVVIRYSKTLTPASSVLKQAYSLKAQIIALTEQEEKSIFPFLDALADRNLYALKQLDSLLNELGGQYLLTMIFYLLRRMILPNKNAPLFVIKKIAKQKASFGIEKIEKIYQKSLEIDFKIKTGLVNEKIGFTLLLNDILTN